MSNQEYRLKDNSGFDALILHQSSAIPQPGRGEIQIKFHACSLNYRDLVVSKGIYPLPMKENLVPVSEEVIQFKVGDRVSPNFNLAHIGGELTEQGFLSGLGGRVDGCLRHYGVFPALSCVKIPKSLSYEEAATLPCAALTAWNSLYGSADKKLQPGQTVLVQGTGGVSVFGAQFALAAGAKVILTSSSNEKIALMKKHLGEKNVLTINYREIPEWGKKAKEISDGGRGVDHILEIGGMYTLKESLEALAFGGSIGLIGAVGYNGKNDDSSKIDFNDFVKLTIAKNATVRGVLIGSVEQFNNMNRTIDMHQIKPIVDKVFQFQDVKSAYEYQWSQQHVGKVVIKVAEK